MVYFLLASCLISCLITSPRQVCNLHYAALYIVQIHLKMLVKLSSPSKLSSCSWWHHNNHYDNWIIVIKLIINHHHHIHHHYHHHCRQENAASRPLLHHVYSFRFHCLLRRCFGNKKMSSFTLWSHCHNVIINDDHNGSNYILRPNII